MNVTLIQTGGTIDKDYPKTMNGWAFEIGDAAFFRIIAKLPKSIEWETISLFRKDSTELTDEDRAELLKVCRFTANRRIIITHGTDTLLKTAEVLAVITDKKIVLTGAMKPERFSDSDADLHFGMALAGVQTLSNGVYIAVQGIISPFRNLHRDMQTGLFYVK
jgi:L-asparaginase